MTMQKVPDDLVELSEQVAESQEGEEQAASLLTCLFARLCNLLAACKDSNIDRTQIIAGALALDDELEQWSSGLPEQYEYSRIPAEPFAKAYANHCDVYSSVFSAQVWNIYRSARLGANGIIVGQLSLLNMEHAQPDSNDTQDVLPGAERNPVFGLTELQNRLAILETLREDFCASIPFLLERHNQARTVGGLPLCYRTPVMHQLKMITRSVGASEKMCNWAREQIDELQCDEEVVQGGIWMSTSQSKIKI